MNVRTVQHVSDFVRGCVPTAVDNVNRVALKQSHRIILAAACYLVLRPLTRRGNARPRFY